MLKRRLSAAVSALLVLALGPFCLAGPWYTATPLETGGGGLGLSNAAHVTGGLAGGSAFLWEDGFVTEIGTLPGHSLSAGHAVNSSGQIAGWSGIWPSGEEYPREMRAIFWDDGVLTDVGTLEGDPGSWAHDINESGQVVGFSGAIDESYENRPFLWEDGVITELATLAGGFGQPLGINDDGEVTGWSLAADALQHACIWSDGGITDLGLPSGALYSQGRGINNQGQVAGWAGNWLEGWSRRAMLWDGGACTDLGTLGGAYSRGYSINEAGQIVGDSTTWGGEEHAFLRQNGVTCDLNNLVPAEFDWVLYRAQDINDSGEILVKGTREGEVAAFLLTPVPVPAPGALVLGIFGIGVAGVFRWIRRL